MKSKQFSTSSFNVIKVLIAGFALLSMPAFAQNLKVAVAANLQPVMAPLAKDFKAKTGITIEPIVGSSGNLVAQIKNGAPYDVFLSADMNFPQELFKNGFSLREPVVYASGTLIICSSQNVGFENWTRVLMSERVKKIAIGNPSIAPYGKAATETLQLKGVLQEIKGKLVYGESIAQVNTYISTGVADVGFTTLSFVKDPGNNKPFYWKIIDPKTYKPIEQGMVILKHAENEAAAGRFYQYIFSPAAKKILTAYGYHVKLNS